MGYYTARTVTIIILILLVYIAIKLVIAIYKCIQSGLRNNKLKFSFLLFFSLVYIALIVFGYMRHLRYEQQQADIQIERMNTAKAYASELAKVFYENQADFEYITSFMNLNIKESVNIQLFVNEDASNFVFTFSPPEIEKKFDNESIQSLKNLAKLGFTSISNNFDTPQFGLSFDILIPDITSSWIFYRSPNYPIEEETSIYYEERIDSCWYVGFIVHPPLYS